MASLVDWLRSHDREISGHVPDQLRKFSVKGLACETSLADLLRMYALGRSV